MLGFALRRYVFTLPGLALLAACGGSSLQPPDRTDVALHGAAPLYKVVVDFKRGYGTHPAAPLIDVGNTLYGTTRTGGRYKKGTVYSIESTGKLSVLHDFGEGSDGYEPEAAVIDVNGTLYGTTARGGTSGAGTVYAISPSGSEEVLYSFTGGADGGIPWSPVIDIDGALYGTTVTGGNGDCKSGSYAGCGTVYTVSVGGSEHVLHSFAGGSDGEFPYSGLLDVKGMLYGTTVGGGEATGYSSCCGTVFTITTGGEEKVLHAFTGSDGAGPGPVIDVGGTFYGTTGAGGNTYVGSGAVYSMSTSGIVKVLHYFTDEKTDGQLPEGTLANMGGVLYGTTKLGGTSCRHAVCGNGTLFRVTLSGSEKVLYRFSDSSGYYPLSGLTAVKGVLYGTTSVGGEWCADMNKHNWTGCGTIFTYSP